MRIVNIYIGTDSASTRKSKKSYGYVLETVINNEPITKHGFGELEATYNRVVLAAVNEALERMKEPCEIHIHSENSYVLGMIKTSVSKWSQNGFMTSKEKPVKNQDEWIRYWNNAKKHLIVTCEGRHSYSNWIKEEIERRVKNENVTV